MELDLPPEQAAVGVDLVNHHPCHVGVGAAHEHFPFLLEGDN
jgi:hypothetical protein